MKQIYLTQGKTAQVDDEDFSRLNKFLWHARLEGRVWYAARHGSSAGGQKRRVIKMHNEVIQFLGAPLTDHKNGDGLDNQKENLRGCSKQQNGFNSQKRVGASSQFKGVHWYKSRGLYQAYIGGGVTQKKHLGYFKGETEAARAYDAAALKYYGDFARLNFPKIKP